MPVTEVRSDEHIVSTVSPCNRRAENDVEDEEEDISDVAPMVRKCETLTCISGLRSCLESAAGTDQAALYSLLDP